MNPEDLAEQPSWCYSNVITPDMLAKQQPTVRPDWLHEVRYNNDRTALNAELAELRKQNELLSDGLGIALACSVVCLFIMFLILMGIIAKGWAM